MKYKILINDRSYSSWSFVDDETNLPLETIPNFHPLDAKIFTKDVFLFNKDDNISILIQSHIRKNAKIAGVLMLSQNKTYGRTANKKRLLYKCIPDDKHLPAFLVPYDIKIGFNKEIVNRYVVFKFDNWTDTHPHGLLLENLGEVGNLDAFYEYQLFCKSLHHSLSEFTNKTREQLLEKSNDEYLHDILKNPNFNITDRRNEFVFTIDPKGSADFDDGFSIIPYIDGDTNKSGYKVSIYIANVYFWLETLKLWKSFSSRVSTIYLPDKKRPMLPSVLSDNLCSLQAGIPRFALTMDIIIIDEKVENIELCNTVIQVSNNFVYESLELLYKTPQYKWLFDLSVKMDKSIEDSHDLVSYWMIYMNKMVGHRMFTQKIGIFRCAEFTPDLTIQRELEENLLDKDTERVIKNWGQLSGQYLLYDSQNEKDIKHDVLETQHYTHITSPIRRLVDLLNQIWFSKNMGLINPSVEATDFLAKWLKEMDYLNTSTRSIRKIQTDCEILHRCSTNSGILEAIHSGIVFDKMVKNDGAILYMVYLEKLKILSRITTHQHFDNYTKHDFKIFIFEGEERIKRKIRLQAV